MPLTSTRVALPQEITGDLLRAARVLAGMKADAVAKASMLGLATVKRAEAGVGNLTASNTARLVEAYTRFGVFFVVTDDGCLGVVRKPSLPEQESVA